jgi:iron-sulfur cluster assembly protein
VLTLTDRAAETIRALTSRPGLPADTGLRMSLPDGQDGQAGMVALSLEGPHPDDAVIDDAGARVFVGPDAAQVVQDSQLDARLDEEGRAAFTLNDQRAQA